MLRMILRCVLNNRRHVSLQPHAAPQQTFGIQAASKETTMSRRRNTAPVPKPVSLGMLREIGPEALAQRLAAPPEEAFRWLEAAARYGLVEAQVALGQCL